MEMFTLLNCLQNGGPWAQGQNPKLQVVTQSAAPPAMSAAPMGATPRPALKSQLLGRTFSLRVATRA